ncbi:hypothetical protein [Herbidospora cretacea]|uniref:hypothetical protein n=1 Tax=Herbidospora cretacea TaxID=28444 RepID=UPI000773BEF1|nr:hypothetical protein [Herbidospora cretacea]
MYADLLENKKEGAKAPSSAIDDLYPFAQQVAFGLARRYVSCPIDDIIQEIVLYFLATPKVLLEWEDFWAGDFEDEGEAQHMGNRMRLIARRAGERYCRAELAAQVGYKPEDEAFYSVGLLRVLVEWYYKEGLTQPTRTQGEKVSSSGDPAAGGNWLVSLLDVQRGLERTQRKYRNRLKFRFADMGAYSDAELAAMVANLATAKGKRERIERILGTTEKGIGSRVSYALVKLQKALGGSSPYRKDPMGD